MNLGFQQRWKIPTIALRATKQHHLAPPLLRSPYSRVKMLGLSALYVYSCRHSGIIFVAHKYHQLWKYGPNSVLALDIGLWVQVEYRRKQLTAWEMLLSKTTDTSGSLKIDYFSNMNIVSLFSSAKRKHWGVSLSILGTLLLGLYVAAYVAKSLRQNRTLLAYPVGTTRSVAFQPLKLPIQVHDFEEFRVGSMQYVTAVVDYLSPASVSHLKGVTADGLANYNRYTANAYTDNGPCDDRVLVLLPQDCRPPNQSEADITVALVNCVARDSHGRATMRFENTENGSPPDILSREESQRENGGNTPYGNGLLFSTFTAFDHYRGVDLINESKNITDPLVAKQVLEEFYCPLAIQIFRVTSFTDANETISGVVDAIVQRLTVQQFAFWVVVVLLALVSAACTILMPHSTCGNHARSWLPRDPAALAGTVVLLGVYRDVTGIVRGGRAARTELLEYYTKKCREKKWWRPWGTTQMSKWIAIGLRLMVDDLELNLRLLEPFVALRRGGPTALGAFFNNYFFGLLPRRLWALFRARRFILAAVASGAISMPLSAIVVGDLFTLSDDPSVRESGHLLQMDGFDEFVTHNWTSVFAQETLLSSGWGSGMFNPDAFNLLPLEDFTTELLVIPRFELPPEGWATSASLVSVSTSVSRWRLNCTFIDSQCSEITIPLESDNSNYIGQHFLNEYQQEPLCPYLELGQRRVNFRLSSLGIANITMDPDSPKRSIQPYAVSRHLTFWQNTLFSLNNVSSPMVLPNGVSAVFRDITSTTVPGHISVDELRASEFVSRSRVMAALEARWQKGMAAITRHNLTTTEGYVPPKRVEASLLDYHQRWVIQNEGSTRILQGIFALTLACLAIGFAFGPKDLDRILPFPPTSIGAILFLLEGSKILGEVPQEEELLNGGEKNEPKTRAGCGIIPQGAEALRDSEFRIKVFEAPGREYFLKEWEISHEDTNEENPEGSSVGERVYRIDFEEGTSSKC
ncbi:hypothetical protein B0T26DRAFT_673687 [Lasiosphaeria miniovina]|uniref:Uncharacterized protein n=1 Tax=Lasiosphaeria miniovina TaxID=1954250 RepID=A0AA40ATV2_9PEZI|nr:uncharacterized protein B0T26DRAFT_673687 [Lasiosphaeria miniovina]KAK0721922.1 hypothetical protein B0T26DRAFT_673687 [Lasiosphaeria miniovina]